MDGETERERGGGSVTRSEKASEGLDIATANSGREKRERRSNIIAFAKEVTNSSFTVGQCG